MKWHIIPCLLLIVLLMVLGFQISQVTKGNNQTILLIEVLLGISLTVGTIFIPQQTVSKSVSLPDCSLDQLSLLLKQRATADAVQAVHDALGVK